MMVTGEGIG